MSSAEILPRLLSIRIGNNLHKTSNPVFWEKEEKKVFNLSSAELAKRVEKAQMKLLKSLRNSKDVQEWHQARQRLNKLRQHTC